MKPANFPERVNQRRKGALERLSQKQPKNIVAAQVEMRSLQASIVADASGVFTKNGVALEISPKTNQAEAVPAFEREFANVRAEALKVLELRALSEMRQVKAWKPYRIVWTAIHPETMEYIGAHASITKHSLNRFLRRGYNVYTV